MDNIKMHLQKVILKCKVLYPSSSSRVKRGSPYEYGNDPSVDITTRNFSTAW
jgi:hypothetical protein